MELVGQGAIAVRGNHDDAVSTPERMNVEAQIAIEWTRGQLGAGQRRFLADLPMTARRRTASMCMPMPANPQAGAMSPSVEDAAESFAAVRERLIFCGHIHLPRSIRCR